MAAKVPLTEYKVSLHVVRPEQEQTFPDDVEEFTKVGGAPDWIQEDETPICPDCTELMQLVVQVDSFDNEYQFADMGRLYTFVCFNCNETLSVMQFY